MPIPRRALIAAAMLALALSAQAGRVRAQDGAGGGPSFDVWLSDLVAEARTRGFEDDLLRETLTELEPLPRVIRSDRTQAEVLVTFERYLASRVTPVMVRRGRELSAQHRRVLGRIERTYDVPPRFVLAIWGIETRYGRVTGNTPVFRALATLAWEPRDRKSVV